MKQHLGFFIAGGAVISILLFGHTSFAANGKNIFLNKCGACHKAGGESAVFAPTKYASTQWERFFQRNKHKRKKDISANFNDAELAGVKTYLIDHAADSDQPEAVGLR
ncbi:MAG: cytochrome c [Deltaproteobacteria bacterium]|nr:cytochrome c [Deltaproteobacteria bacterium]